MKNYFFAFIALFFAGLAFGDHNVYVRVSGTTTVDESYYKNHLTIRNNDDDGYILVNAAFRNSGAGDHWVIEITEVNSSGTGTVQWSNEYELLEANNDELSTVPFTIITNLTGDGYVVSGGWQAAGTAAVNHSGILSPYYLEIDDNGNVSNSQRQTINGGTHGFAPLSICKGVGEYVVVGVKSKDFECIECGDGKTGRIAKLSSNLTEKKAVELTSTFSPTVPTPSIAGDSSNFNALAKVKKIPGTNGFIISGSMTANFVDPSEITATLYGNAGISVGYIARIDSNFNNIIWQKKFVDYGTLNPNKTSQKNTTCSNFSFDPSEGNDNIYGVINGIGVNQNQTKTNAEINAGILFDISTSGNVNRVKLFVPSGSPFVFNNLFWTNTYVTEDSIFLCGFGKNLSSTSEYRTLMPVSCSLEKQYLSFGYSYIVDADNLLYDSPPEYEDCYLGMNYRKTNLVYEDLVVATSPGNLSTTTEITDTSKLNQQGPIIYYPSSWEYDDNEHLVCHVPYHAQNSDVSYPSTPTFTFTNSKEFYPSLYFNITSSECNFNSENFALVDEALVMINTNLNPLDSSGEIEKTVSESSLNIIVGDEDCGPKMFPDDHSNTPLINGLDKFGSDGFNNPAHTGSKFVVYDMTGKVIGDFTSKSQIFDDLKSVGVSSGIYIVAEFSENSLIDKQKIIIH